jgi:hypothetical protein
MKETPPIATNRAIPAIAENSTLVTTMNPPDMSARLARDSTLSMLRFFSLTVQWLPRRASEQAETQWIAGVRLQITGLAPGPEENRAARTAECPQ